MLERPIRPGSTAWLFDDLPFARIDEVALEALAITLRALLRRRPVEPGRGRREASQPPSSGDPLRDTLLAVARSNGRIAPAARALGVHRNTVLYRLRRASVELGIDPRRPEDALRLLGDRRPRLTLVVHSAQVIASSAARIRRQRPRRAALRWASIHRRHP